MTTNYPVFFVSLCHLSFIYFFYFKECSVLGDIDSDSDMRLFNKEDFNKCDDTKLNQVENHCGFNYTRFSVYLIATSNKPGAPSQHPATLRSGE